MLRTDQKIIVELIDPNSRVMDIGCCEGELLELLTKEKNISAYGLEIEPERVSAAVGRGLSVIQGNADVDLEYYPDKGFDYVILGLTLQIMQKPKHVLEEALRISKKVIIVIPNFGHLRNRFDFAYNGRMPVTETLTYQWYETPNIHFCTIKDMVSLATELKCTIEKRFYIDSHGNVHKFSGNGSFGANLFGEYGLFVLKS